MTSYRLYFICAYSCTPYIDNEEEARNPSVNSLNSAFKYDCPTIDTKHLIRVDTYRTTGTFQQQIRGIVNTAVTNFVTANTWVPEYVTGAPIDIEIE